jgi:hypothetical protein
MNFRRALLPLASLIACSGAFAQVIDFESGGLKFKTLTHNGVTVMFASLPTQVREYSILQVAVSNGSKITWSIKPEDFHFERADGQVSTGVPAREVVQQLIEHGGRGDVIKLVNAYEASVFGNTRMRSTNGYESRRQAAHAEVGSNKLKAAAAASAIALVPTKLKPGESTDGAVFYSTGGKPLGAGHLYANVAGERFEFDVEAISGAH